MWRTLYFDWWPYFKKRPVIVNPIKCKQMIHRGLLVILQWKFRGWVINIGFIMIFMIFNKKSNIFWYFLFKYDDNLIFFSIFLICQIYCDYCCFGARCVSSWIIHGLKLGIPWKFIFGFSLFLLIFLPGVSKNIKFFFSGGGIPTLNMLMVFMKLYRSTDIYILNISITWQQISVLYLKFGVRFKPIMKHCVC